MRTLEAKLKSILISNAGIWPELIAMQIIKIPIICFWSKTPILTATQTGSSTESGTN